MILRSQPPRWCQIPSSTSWSSATMLRIIFIAATTLFLASSLASVALPALMSAGAGAENYEDVVGNINTITSTPSLLLRGSGIHHNSRQLKDKNKKKKPVVAEEKDDDDDFAVNAAKALIDEASTTKTTTTAAAKSTTTTTKNKGGGDAETAVIAVSSTPIEKQHEVQEEVAEEAGHTSMAQEIEETNNQKEQQPIESMEEDMLMEELDEVLDEIDALDLNNTHGENEAKIEELEEEEMELVEEIFEEEGEDDTYGYDYNDDDVISEVVKEEELEKIAKDDPTGKISQELALAEEIGELEDTIEDIENENDDGASAMIKEDYVEGLKEEEEMILHEIVDEASGGGTNSSMILDKIQEIGTLAKEVENEEDDDDDDYVDSSIWEEGKKEVEEGFQIIENALEEELVSEMNNASKGGGNGDLILDPTLTMDLTQYNDESSETKSNTTVETKVDEMELVSPQVKESESEPLKIDTEPDRDKLGDEEEDVALAEEGGEEEESGTTEEDESTKNGASSEAETATESTVASEETTTTTTTTTASETVVISTPAPTPEETTTPPPPAPVKDPGHWGTTAKPTIEYVEPIDESLDPVANEENTSNEAFEDGKSKSESSAATGTNDESMEEWEEEVEEEVKKVGGWLSFVFMILMIYTAYQMSENPDGICASLCRLVITVIGCILKVALIPCKYILGGGRPSGGHYMATPDYRDPYGSRHMELT